MKRLPFVSWRTARRISQIAFLVLFFWLFRITEATGHGVMSRFVSAWFLFDPLAAIVTMISSRLFIATMLFSLVLVGATLLLGRFFCGWLCPLGTLLDIFAVIVSPIARRTRKWLHLTSYRLLAIKYGLLIVVLVSSLFGVTLTGFVDPFALLFRGMTTAVDPAIAQQADDGSAYLYNHAPSWVTAVSEPTYQFLRAHAMPFGRAAFAGAILGAIPLAIILLLEFADRRFWCKNLCPLGAMYGWLGRWSLVRRFPVKTCGNCGKCAVNCRMGAFDETGRFSPESCNLCMDCVTDCPNDIAAFKTKHVKTKPAEMQPGRRMFIGAAVTGVVVPALVPLTASAKPRAAGQRCVLRPPGVTDEDAFLSQCTRCGECLKVCPTNALHPTVLEAGWVGMFSPQLVPRRGYCEQSCTLCGQVCPTQAIPLLTVAQKQKTRMGIAEFDHSRCLPWAKNEPCIVCEEMCPVAGKAIHVTTVKVMVDGEEVELQRPFVREEHCIGCGICENHCPLDGPAGVRVSTRLTPEHGNGGGRRYRGGRD